MAAIALKERVGIACDVCGCAWVCVCVRNADVSVDRFQSFRSGEGVL